MNLSNADYVFVTDKYIYVEIINSNYTNLTIFDRSVTPPLEVGQLIF
jgi:hypothetical protein